MKRSRVTEASHKAAEGTTGFVPGRRRQWGKRKMGTERRRIILATVGVFILLSAIFVISAGNSFKRDSAHTLAQAELNAKVYTGELERDFEQGIAIAKAVEEVVISGQGQIPRLQTVAKT